MPRAMLSVVVLGIAALTWRVDTAAPYYFPDDPLWQEPETQDASGAQPEDIPLVADLVMNSFSNLGQGEIGLRAGNTNTVDEVPNSGWFTNRILTRPISDDELMRGPNTMSGPAPGGWKVIRPKTAGFAPGFTVQDTRGETWFLTFDPKDEPNAATGAIAVATRLFWALGYYQVESYLATLDPAMLSVADTAIVHLPSGHRRGMTMRDVEKVLDRAAQRPDGTYRVIAARAVPGKVLGGFRYHGTRPDDPNDTVPHEHRRELRALKVFGAWANLVDLKAGNTLDSVIEQNGRGIVRHYLQDVGSTFGTGALGPREWDEGWEHVYEGSPLWKRLVTLGFYLRPWQTVHYEKAPEIGRFEGDTFNPEEWRSRVPAAAVVYARDDDTFWAALRVAAFSDDLIRTAVSAGEYEDPRSAQLLTEVLIKRRDKIASAYLARINPLTDFSLSADGSLRFENAAVRNGVAGPPAGGYRAVWLRFDNATAATTPLGAPSTSADTEIRASADILRQAGDFIRVSVSAVDASHPEWVRPVNVSFRREASGWKLVGLDRLP